MAHNESPTHHLCQVAIWNINNWVSLQCRRILGAQKHIFVFSYYATILDLVTAEDWGKEVNLIYLAFHS